MIRDRTPVTPAVRALRAAGVAFTDHPYDYEEKGGTAVPAKELGVDEHAVVKTLPRTSPFGTRRPMPVVMEETVLALPKIFVNGGKRSYLVGVDPKDVQRLLAPRLVRVGIPG